MLILPKCGAALYEREKHRDKDMKMDRWKNNFEKYWLIVSAGEKGRKYDSCCISIIRVSNRVYNPLIWWVYVVRSSSNVTTCSIWVTVSIISCYSWSFCLVMWCTYEISQEIYEWKKKCSHVLHGGHQVAKKSTTTNFPELLDSSIRAFQSSTEFITRTNEP